MRAQQGATYKSHTKLRARDAGRRQHHSYFARKFPKNVKWGWPAHGALVSDVMRDSPGEKAGLRAGDLITELDGKQILSSGDLQLEVVLRHPGDSVQLQVARDGKILKILVTSEAREGDSKRFPESDGSGESRRGVPLQYLTPELRSQIQTPDDIEGAVVRSVRSGSSAEAAGLSPVDVVVAVNRKPTSSSADVTRELGSIPEGQDALVMVWSNGAKTFRVLHPVAAEGE